MYESTVASGEVSVERSTFGLAEEDPFLEAATIWMELEFSEESPSVQVAQGQVKTLSNFRDHYARVTLKLCASPIEGLDGWSSIAQLPYRSRGGIVEAWTLFSGPCGISIDLQAAQAEFLLQVFRRTAADAQILELDSMEVPHELEEYIFAFSRKP